MKAILFFCLLINCALLLYGCGETKEDIECRGGLNGIIKETNSFYKKFDNDKTFEVNLKTNEVRDFYGEYVDKLMELARGHNNIKITDKYKIIYNRLDTLIESSIDYMMERKNARLGAYKVYNAREKWMSFIEMGATYEALYGKNHPLTKGTRKDESYPKTLIILRYLDYNGIILKIDSIRYVLEYQVQNINKFIKKLEFNDSLNIIPTITMKNDLFKNESQKINILYHQASMD